MEKEFGEYLKNLRSSRVPAMTQEALATAIGRGKMTISQFENAKNSPPQGELLEKIREVYLLDLMKLKKADKYSIDNFNEYFSSNCYYIFIS